MRKLAIAVFAVVSTITSNSFYQICAKAAPRYKTIKAAFFLTKDSEAKPIADREVIVIPCAPINGNCQQIIDTLMKSLSGISNSNSENSKLLDNNIKEEFKKLIDVSILRTGIDGSVLAQCPTTNCLIYSSTIRESESIFWLKLQRQGTESNYLPSEGIRLAASVKSPEMEELGKALSTLNARLEVGISYASLSDAVTPFVLALNNAKSSPDASTYRDFIRFCERISVQLDLLSKAWQAYINGTQVIYGKTFHLAHEDFVVPLVELFNQVSGYTAITLSKPSSGFLAAIFGTQNFYNMEGLTSIMLTEIGRKVDLAIATYKDHNAVSNKIPKISFSDSTEEQSTNTVEQRSSFNDQRVPNPYFKPLDCSIQQNRFFCP